MLVDLIAHMPEIAQNVDGIEHSVRCGIGRRDQTREQWLGMLHAAGVVGEVAGTWPLRMQFDSWVVRMHTPSDQVAAIHKTIDQAPREVREALAVEADYSFTVEIALIIGRKPA